MKRVIKASQTKIEPNGKIQVGMWWSVDGHHMEITSVDGDTCTLTEDWIAEDSGKDCSESDTYGIGQDEDGVEYAYALDYPKFKLYSTSAFNYPYDSF